MNAHQLKAICHQLADLFGHKAVADAADVCASVWSDYCNYEKPGTTIPGHRMILVEDRLHRRDFTNAFADRARAGEVQASDPRPMAAKALAALSGAFTGLTEVLADDNVSEAEKRRLHDEIATLSARVHELSASVAALPTGRVRLKAVS